jgi:hypothetical protein
MGELERQTGEVDFPVNRTSIDQAEREACCQIFRLTNDAVLGAIETEVTKAEKITDPQVKHYYLPFLEASLKLYQRRSLEQEERSIAFVEAIANTYRRRIYY